MELNAPPSAGSRSSDLAGRPLIITEVKGERMVDTTIGESVAVVIDVLVLDTGTPVGFVGDDDYSPGEPCLNHIPEVLIFWSVVQRQLLSSDFRPPVAGRFVQKGKAYTLDALTPEELALISSL